jgi:hypothetical protein
LNSGFERVSEAMSPAVNRLVLDDGKAIERATYFDPLVIAPTLLRHPSIWWRWWRTRGA